MMVKLKKLCGLTFLVAFFLCLLLSTTPIIAEENELSPYTGLVLSDKINGENLCAITFDDGPSQYTPQLLDMLDSYGVQATFFMLGSSAAHFPDTVRRVLSEGHEVGNHSYSHANLKAVTYDRKMSEIGHTDEILRSLGASPSLFRPPYGNSDSAVVEVAAKYGLRVIIWSLDTLDWKRLPADYTQLRDAHGKLAAPGHLHGVFLFHDIHKRTVEDLPRIMAQLVAGGCQRFVTASDYMNGLFDDTEPGFLMTRHTRSQAVAMATAAPVTAPLSPIAQPDSNESRDSPVRAPSKDTASPATHHESTASLQPRPWAGFAKDAVSVNYSLDAQSHLSQDTPNQTAIIPNERHAQGGDNYVHMPINQSTAPTDIDLTVNGSRVPAETTTTEPQNSSIPTTADEKSH